MNKAHLRGLGCAALVVVSVAACAKRNPPGNERVAQAVASAGERADGAPSGYVTVSVGGMARMPGGGDAVLLVDQRTKRVLPISIGGTEALSIQLRIQKKAYKRPLTHDLLETVIAKLGGRVLSVRVDKLEDSIFYGTITLLDGDKKVELDARPSDAVALAVGSGAPVYVATSVLDHAGIDLDRGELEPAPHPDQPEPVSL